MSSFREAIFDRDDTPQDFDQTDAVEVTSYLATATRTGRYWTATVKDLPGGHVVRAQGSTWKELGSNVLDCLVDLLDSDDVGASLVPADPDAAGALKALSEARTARVLAEQAERDAARHAARLLSDQGWTVRDIGSALGLSHQRISQIAPRAAT
ncbi:type II toxin-antitoxin system HicB family antitoxin [Nonomuraea sp. NPDC002799]